MGPIRGRPRKINQDEIIDAVLSHKRELLLPNNAIVTKLDPVWKTISNELNGIILPLSLYTFVTCNKYGLRDKLSNSRSVAAIDDHEPCDISTGQNDVGEISNESVTTDMEHFVIFLTRSEYEILLVDRAYKRTESDRRNVYTRQCTVMLPGKWQKVITEKIWDSQRLKCAWNFKNHKITTDARSGYMNGECKCGSTIRCEIDDLNSADNMISVTCTVTPGDSRGVCGKVYLRAPDRQEIAKQLDGKSASVYRTKMANELMLPGEPEPPHLYTTSVLNTAKNEYASSKHLDRDPVKALAIMTLSSMKNTLHSLGLNPFFAHYWTNHQLHVYREYSSREPACISIDATGSIVKKINRPDKSKSSHIFLYECVVNCSVGGQYSVSQMTTESHNTNSIYFWLMEWIRTGASPPKEVVCDSSKALLTAVVRAFTNYSTIEDYADGCKLSTTPKCYVRIDVAHFIKMYARFMKHVNVRVKRFFLTALGQLIMTCDLDTATEILTSILVVARSETEGEAENGRITYCEIHKKKLRDIFIGTTEMADVIDDVNEKSSESDVPIEENSCVSNSWGTWAKEIDDRVKSMAQSAEGNRDNAHFFPQLADRLVKDVKWLPLWSCVYRNQFGYGRVPASSASVEGDFNNIKNRLLENVTLPMRVDDFIKTHVDFINGRLKIVDAQSDTIIPASSPVAEIGGEQTSIAQIQLQSPVNTCPSCPACNNGDHPTGAHVCALCSRPVHALDLCSTAMEGDSEGYGQRRICAACKNIGDLPVILASREVEDWRGLVAPVDKKKGRYLQRSYAMNEFILHEKLKKMPIMKNGSSLTLQSVKFGRERISLRNTCAFDSLLQIFLAALQDRPLLKEAACHQYKDNNFFKLVLDILSKGLTNSSYRLRTEILRQIFPAIRRPNNSSLIECDVTIADLARELFKETPALSEIFICDNGCPPRPKSLAIFQALPSSLTNGEFAKIIEREIAIREPRACCTEGCMGLESTSITEMGHFVAFDVFPILGDPDRAEIRLDDIPTVIEISPTKNYRLIGVVNFEPPATKVNTRSSIDGLGHYTAISLRPGDTWIKYDDTKEKETIVSKTTKTYAHMIIYAP